MYINITPAEVVIQRVKNSTDLSICLSNNKYMYKDITYTSPIKIVTGPTLYNNAGSTYPQLRYTTPLLEMSISANGSPPYVQPTFIHFDIQ